MSLKTLYLSDIPRHAQSLAFGLKRGGGQELPAGFRPTSIPSALSKDLVRPEGPCTAGYQGFYTSNFYT